MFSYIKEIQKRNIDTRRGSGQDGVSGFSGWDEYVPGDIKREVEMTRSDSLRGSVEQTSHSGTELVGPIQPPPSHPPPCSPPPASRSGTAALQTFIKRRTLSAGRNNLTGWVQPQCRSSFVVKLLTLTNARLVWWERAASVWVVCNVCRSRRDLPPVTLSSLLQEYVPSDVREWVYIRNRACQHFEPDQPTGQTRRMFVWISRTFL